MSTFSGKIKEIPHISVDRFDGDNFNSQAYFLSHCHTDHMIGLSNYSFQNHLMENNKYLYASEVSCAILKNQFYRLRNNVKILDICTPTIVLLEGGNVSVLPIPAGHCPGSVMFLFETNIRILYTGDYRINKSDIRKLSPFYDSYKQVKKIEKIYLDTTFFLKSYLRFPKRDESIDEVCKIIKEWTGKGKNFMINLYTSAKYGYEYMFSEIYLKTGMPIHVNKGIYDFYSIIPKMDNVVTLNGASTQIHCSCGSSYRYLCNEAGNSKLRVIKVSAFRWTQDDLEDGISTNSYEMYYVCYSTHASYEEGVELLRFLKPKSVEVCVKHDDIDANIEIDTLIEEVLDECKPVAALKFKHKLFESEESISEESSSVIEGEITSDGFDFGILDSPPRNTRKINKKLSITNVKAVSYSVNEGLSSSDNSESINLIQMQSVETQSDGLVVQNTLDVVELENICTESPSKKIKNEWLL